MIIIHNGNWAEFAENIHKGHPGLCGTRPRSTMVGGLECARPYAEVIDLIPESKWSQYYEAMVGRFVRQKYESFKPLLHNQGSHPLCWAYSLAQHLECVRAKQGLPYIQLAPESISGSNGYRDAGWMLDSALDYVTNYGMAPRSLVPQYAIKPNQWNPKYKNAALNYVPLERFDLGTKDMWAECMTALLSGDAIYVGYNWLAHAMNGEELQKKNGEFCLWTPNTWGEGQDMLLSGRKKIPDEAYVVRQVTYSK